MGKPQKSGGMKWWIILVLLLAAGGGGWWYYKNKQPSTPEFTITKLTRGDVIQAVTATGTLNPVLNVQVGSQVSGIIQQLFADFNSVVKSNQIIAQLDPATYRANLASAESELASAKASLLLAQVNARRAIELIATGLISQAEHDQAIATLSQAEAQVQIRTASVERVRVDLGRCTIYAPVDGTVISRNVDVGQTVAASMSAPVLFQIASDLTKMQINASVAEADVGTVAEGQEVEFTVDAFPERTFAGKVIQVRNAPLTVQNVVTYDTIIEVNNADLKLKPGMTANVSIIVQRRENVLRLPNGALRFRPSEEWVEPVATNTTPTVAATGGGTNNPPMAGEPGMRRGPGGGGGERGMGRGGRGGSRGAAGERRNMQTLYVLPTETAAKVGAVKLKAVRARLGITDGIFTEIIEGISENDVLVTGANTPTEAGAPGTQNPFGGGGRPGGMRRF
jgi:HlyD family secretion protein